MSLSCKNVLGLKISFVIEFIFNFPEVKYHGLYENDFFEITKAYIINQYNGHLRG